MGVKMYVKVKITMMKIVIDYDDSGHSASFN